MNREEAEPKIIRNHIYEWFTSTVLTRLEKDEREDDLIGRLLGESEKFVETNGEEGSPWEHVELQAIDETTGQALWPEKKSANDLRRIRGEAAPWPLRDEGNNAPPA